MNDAIAIVGELGELSVDAKNAGLLLQSLIGKTYVVTALPSNRGKTVDFEIIKMRGNGEILGRFTFGEIVCSWWTDRRATKRDRAYLRDGLQRPFTRDDIEECARNFLEGRK